jgi:diadenosine tetraphosphatase ApaH/serine/threonine PP2A family protein phosphatase
VLLAILSDVHANLQALDACLAHARERHAEQYAFLGDLVGYGGDPGAVVDAVMALSAKGAFAVQGNHDLGAFGGVDAAEVSSDAGDSRTALEWTRGALNPAQLEFLSALPLSRRVDKTLFVHASAAAPQEFPYIRGPDGARDSLKATDASLTFVGHMHHQRLYYLGADQQAYSFTPTPGVAIPVASHRRWLAVVGSVGQPRDRDNQAAYVLHDTARRTVAFHRVPYDWQGAARRIREMNLPDFFADRLEDGV